MKSRPRLTLVSSMPERPLRVLSMAEKRANAIAYLERRRIYVLQRGSKRPGWGIAGAFNAKEGK